MVRNKIKILKCEINIKLILSLVLFCFFCALASAQTTAVEKVNNDVANMQQQKVLEQELMNIIQQGVDSKAISVGLRDTIMQFILSLDKTIIMRDVNSILIQQIDNVLPQEIKNGINTSMSFPNKLRIPERDSKNRYQYMTQEELKKDIMRVDYFSKGLIGYYNKLIEMGYMGQGWAETKEMREAIDKLKSSVIANLSDLGESGDPNFVKKLYNSNNPIKKLLGTLLMMLNNGARVNSVGGGYHNPNRLIVTPPVPKVGHTPIPSYK